MNPYQRFRNMTTRRLALVEDGGYGEELIVVTNVRQSYDTETSSAVITGTEYKGSGLKINFKQYHITNNLVKQDDVNFYISPIAKITVPDEDWIPDEDQTEEDRPDIEVEVDIPPITSADFIIFQNVKYSVVNSKPWNNAGVLMGYKVQGRVAK